MLQPLAALRSAANPPSSSHYIPTEVLAYAPKNLTRMEGHILSRVTRTLRALFICYAIVRKNISVLLHDAIHFLCIHAVDSLSLPGELDVCKNGFTGVSYIGGRWWT